MSKAPLDLGERHHILFDNEFGLRIKAESTQNPDAPYTIITYKKDEFGNDLVDVMPDAVLEIDTSKNTSNFVIRVLERTKESAMHHPKATVFTITSTIAGIATGIMVIRRRHHK